jgi:Integrase zinc binding domain
VRPSGEFQVIVPDTIPTSDPIAVERESFDLDLHTSLLSNCDEDATDLRRGVTSSLSPLVCSNRISPLARPKQVVPFALALALDELPREITLNELREEQVRDPEIRDLLATGGPGRVIDVNFYGIIVRKAPLDGCEQILVPRSLRPIVLHLEHHTKSIGHPGVTKMFATMGQRYFWRNMYKDVEETVRQCIPCAKNRVQERKRVSMMKMFPANEPPEFVAIDILGPLPKTVHGNRFLLVILDRFSKLTRTIPMRTTTALAVAKAFCTHWGFSYGPPKFLLSDNGTQFTAKYFIEVCRELVIAKRFTTA